MIHKCDTKAASSSMKPVHLAHNTKHHSKQHSQTWPDMLAKYMTYTEQLHEALAIFWSSGTVLRKPSHSELQYSVHRKKSYVTLSQVLHNTDNP